MTTIDEVISTPGEILLEEFLQPLGISRISWLKPSASPSPLYLISFMGGGL